MLVKKSFSLGKPASKLVGVAPIINSFRRFVATIVHIRSGCSKRFDYRKRLRIIAIYEFSKPIIGLLLISHWSLISQVVAEGGTCCKRVDSWRSSFLIFLRRISC
ncbi:hypothetical protein L218DRAFT_494608 [Marasmius fiardii PR-910]|nr:hypothetical protein L218DRAFT_494608 [Marasmius fiardii PR-910]